MTRTPINPEDYKKAPGGLFLPGEQVDERRRTMKAGQIKRTRFGDVYFKIVVDLPREMPEDDFKKVMYEYGGILQEAFGK